MSHISNYRRKSLGYISVLLVFDKYHFCDGGGRSFGQNCPSEMLPAEVVDRK